MKKTYLFFFILLGFYTNAQRISGTIIDSDTKKPLQDTFVFVENSSISTLSKKDGTFQIDLNGLNNNIIIDKIGYTTNFIPKEDLNRRSFIVNLKPSEEVLEELIIEASPFSRKKMMQVFKKYFLGNTANGKSCKIINENDIVLYFDTKTNILHAESSVPILIENKNLDYEIKFFLEDFQANFNARSLDFFNYTGSSFFGYSSYVDTSKNKNRSNEKRTKVYENGVPSFLKSLATNKLSEKNLTFYVDKFPVNTDDYFKSEERENGYVIYNIKTPMKNVPKPPKKGQRMVIVAGELGETIEVPTNFNLYNSKNKNQSIVKLNSEEIEIDKNGNLINPSQVYFGGYFGDLKLGDMLPIDFIIK